MVAAGMDHQLFRFPGIFIDGCCMRERHDVVFFAMHHKDMAQFRQAVADVKFIWGRLLGG